MAPKLGSMCIDERAESREDVWLLTVEFVVDAPKFAIGRRCASRELAYRVSQGRRCSDGTNRLQR